MKKQTRQVTVELVGTEAERLADGVTRWFVRRGERLATIVHMHDEQDRENHHASAWYCVDSPAECGLIHGRDFGAALAAARRLLGVRS